MIDFGVINGSGNTENNFALPKTEVDKQAFLELLVTQLKTQDPFEPLKNEDFLAQLAQFSSLESLNNIHAEMSASNLLQNSVHNALSTSLLGNYAVTSGNTVAVSGDDVGDAMFVMSESGDVKIEIADAAGRVVRTIERDNVDSGEQLVEWDGKDNDDNAVADGSYSIRVEYKSGVQAGQSANVFSVGKIRAVRFFGGTPILVIDDQEFQLSDVIEVMDSLPGSDD